MKKTILSLALGLAASAYMPASAQDVHFSQIFETPLLRNPALAGLFSGDVRLQSVYRTQWNSVTTPYQTASIHGEFKLPVGQGDDFLTIGGQVVYDKAGTVALTTTQVLPALNYHKSLSDEKNVYLSIGFMGGWVQRKLDVSKMTTNSQFDGNNYNPSLGTGEALTSPSYSYMDGSAGMSFMSQIGENEDNNLFVGLAYHHFNRPKKLSFYSSTDVEMLPRLVASGGIRVSISESSFVTFEADYSKQGSFSETVGGALFTWKLGDYENPRYLFHAGSYFRWKDALIPAAKLECRPLAIAVSYDANISPLKTGSRGQGGFELSLTYQKFINSYNSSSEAVRCPRF